MKIRSVLCALAATAAATVFADVTSNVCGLLKITSDLNNTIIGVPWVEVGTTPDADIKVAKLVKTDNLSAGDMLYYYNAGTWNAWTLGAQGWQPNTTVTVDGKTVAAPQDAQGIARGQALILERKDVTKPFYLYGQFTTAAAAAQAITAGSATAPTYTLLASPKVEAFDFNATGKIANPGADDEIIIPKNGGDNTILTLQDGKWGYRKATTTKKFGKTVTTYTWTEATPLAAGTGFWYVSKGGSPTINW